MTTHTSISLRSDDRVSEIVKVEIEEIVPGVTVQRVSINLGVNSIHMNFKQFEEFLKVGILKSGEEYARREQERLMESKRVRPLNLNIGDSLDLNDSLGGK